MGAKHFGSPIPQKLKQARIARGMSIAELAEKVGVTRQAISQYELGQNNPRAEIFMRIVAVLDFPKAFFYKENTKNTPKSATFFRSLASATKRSRDMQDIRAEWMLDIYNYIKQFIKLPELNLIEVEDRSLEDWNFNEIEDLAMQLREHWELGNRPVKNIVNLIEKNGFAISVTNFNDSKLDAFSVWMGNTPFIILNNEKESGVRRRFNVAHELGHILMHSSIIDDTQELSKNDFNLMESQAHHFASAFLLPEDSFINSVYSISLDHFVELKEYWKVSISAMIRRCKDLEIINDNQYLYLNKKISQNKWRTFEPLDEVIKVEKPTVFNKAINLLLDTSVQNIDQILGNLPYPIEDLESLCGISPSTLSRGSAEEFPIPRLKDEF